jgi:hypothetical protein
MFDRSPHGVQELGPGHQSCQCPLRHHKNKKPFTEEEDRIIIEFIRSNGPRNWNAIAAEVKNRTPKQCRERWHNHLDPDVRKDPFSQEEDEIIATKQAALGSKWAAIARFLPGRTDTLVKNRWNSSLKKRIVIDTCGRITVAPIRRAAEDSTPSAVPPPEESKVSLGSWLVDFNRGGKLPMSDSIPPLIPRNGVRERARIHDFV